MSYIRTGPVKLRWAAAGWAVALATVLVVASATAPLPRSTEGYMVSRGIEVRALTVVVVLLLLSSAAAFALPAGAPVVAAVAAAGFWALASYTYPAAVGIAVTAAIGAVAFGLGGAWAAHRRARATVALAMVTLVAVGAAGLSVARVYDRYYGPTHPASTVAKLPVDHVEWAWAGAVTTNRATVVARLTERSSDVRLVVSTRPELTNPTTSDVGATDEDRVVKLSIDGLVPGTEYHYTISVDGEADARYRARFRTFPDGAASFRFAFSGDARTGSNGAVFDAIRAADPLFYVVTGDMFYANVNRDDRGAFRRAYGATLTSPAQAALYRAVPIAYLWDDHDYGANDSDRTSKGRAAAHDVYRQVVPHYPLDAAAQAPIFQAFTVGRVRIVLTDTRSARSPSPMPDGSQPTMLGAEQLGWLEQELGRASEYALVIWVNPDPWIDVDDPGADSWGGYAAERRRIADLIAELGVRNLVMLNGDAHMIAADDGTNSDYATGTGAGMPVYVAAPLDRRGEIKGGPYSEGVRAKGGQFGLIEVDDNGSDPVRVTFRGRDWTGAEYITHRFVVPAG